MLRLGKLTFYVLLFVAGILTHSILYHFFQTMNKANRETVWRVSPGVSGRRGVKPHENDSHVYQGESTDDVIDRMASVLAHKLSAVADSEKTERFVSCINEEVIGNSCDSSGCLRLQLPASLRERVEQLVKPDHLRLPDNVTDVLRGMRGMVPGSYDTIIVTAASSNHFEEVRSMISNVRLYLLPRLGNFTFIVYNLGLAEHEVTQIANNCNCRIVHFPFEKLTTLLGYVKCYTWKPLIVSAHLSQTNLLLWADASIRFHQNWDHTQILLNRARARGIQLGWSPNSIAYTTLQSMFHFFGDEACVYLPYMSSLNTIIVLHNEDFIRRVIVEPWAACAVSGQCMCPEHGQDLQRIRISCHKRKGKYDYGICHRFDQSALSIIGTKLYQEGARHIFLENIRNFVDVKRGDKTLEKGSPFYGNDSP